jgi:putative nucleotidyltransferase with HDIG domain
MIHETQIDDMINTMETRHELPLVAIEVNKMLDNPDVEVHELANVIMMDPSLTMKILKLCNSAQYGFSRQIATLSEAVSILGYQTLKRVIFTIISHGCLDRAVLGYALERGDLWENAITCAVYARNIAQRLEFKDPELAFVGALIRDIGKIALEEHIDGKGQDLAETALQQKSSFSDAEETIAGVSHTIVGLHIAQRWKLPDSLCHVIRYHHQPSKLPADISQDDAQLVTIVHLADTYTMMTGSGLGIDGLMYPLDLDALKFINLTPENAVLEPIYCDLLKLKEEIHTLMSTFLNG